jgi:hypothetical protein
MGDTSVTKQHLLSPLENTVDQAELSEIHSNAMLIYPIGMGCHRPPTHAGQQSYAATIIIYLSEN